jgi:hypothetical protein
MGSCAEPCSTGGWVVTIAANEIRAQRETGRVREAATIERILSQEALYCRLEAVLECLK